MDFSISLIIFFTLSNFSPVIFGVLHLFGHEKYGLYFPFRTCITLSHSGHISISSKNSKSEL